MKKTVILGVVVVFAIVLGGCSAKKPDNVVLNLGMMPAVDAAPILYAQEKGIFDGLNLEVNVDIYQNAMERQSALQSHQIDGALTDVIALMQNVNAGFDMKITLSTDTSFLLLAKDPNRLDAEHLKAALMEVSVTNYLTDQALAGKSVEKIYINDIPARLEMIGSGNVDVAVIPEPVASMGVLNGLTKTAIKVNDSFSPNVIVFTDKAIAEKHDAIQTFHQGYNQAVTAMANDEAGVRSILVNRLGLKPEIEQDIVLPQYQVIRVPSKEYLEKLATWSQNVLNTIVTVDYDSMVDAQFVQ